MNYIFLKENLENLSNRILTQNIINILKTMVPFVPHIANECLELMNCENLDKWPKIDKTKLSEQVKLAVQIN